MARLKRKTAVAGSLAGMLGAVLLGLAWRPPAASAQPPVGPPPSPPPAAAPAQPAPPRTPPPPSRRLPPPPSSSTVAYVQPAPPRTANRGGSLTAPDRLRLASAPDMFGDSLYRGPILLLSETSLLGDVLLTHAPLAGGSRGAARAADLNKPLPVDRWYASYHHFEGAVPVLTQSTTNPAFVRRQVLSVDRLLLGTERTFLDGLTSVEVRLPLLGGAFLNQDVTPLRFPAGFSAGDVGNVSVLSKWLLSQGANHALAAGVGFEAPTGSDTTATLDLGVLSTRITFDNRTFYVQPFAGLLVTPGERWFASAFAQLELPLNGDPLLLSENGDSAVSQGVYTPPELLLLDVGAGYWLLRNPEARLLTGLALLGEAHYTAALGPQDSLVASTSSLGPPFVDAAVIGESGAWDVLNVTAAVHAEIANHSTLRVGGVFPLRSAPHRSYDAEFTVQWIQRY